MKRHQKVWTTTAVPRMASDSGTALLRCMQPSAAEQRSRGAAVEPGPNIPPLAAWPTDCTQISKTLSHTYAHRVSHRKKSFCESRIFLRCDSRETGKSPNRNHRGPHSTAATQSVRQIQKSRLEVALLFATAGNLRGLEKKILNGTQN